PPYNQRSVSPQVSPHSSNKRRSPGGMFAQSAFITAFFIRMSSHRGRRRARRERQPPLSPAVFSVAQLFVQLEIAVGVPCTGILNFERSQVMSRSYRRGVSVRRVTQYLACAVCLLLCAAIFNAQSAPRDPGPRYARAGAGGPFPGLSKLSRHAFAGASYKFKDDDKDDDKDGDSVSGRIKTVFVIAMENHNWTQPENKFTGGIQQIYQNVNAPFINSLVNGSAVVVLNGSAVNISKQVAYATAYHSLLATPSENNPQTHPSEPNYIWAEAGDNFGVLNDRDPYNGTNQETTDHLSGFLTQAGKTWRSYQEDIDLTRDSAGQLTNVPLPQDLWTVPLTSFSGVFAVGSFNAYNFSNQYNYAPKHNPMVFFTDTNGGNNATPSNPLSTHYAPLQQLASDLADDSVADYNWITPNQYNDM